MSSRVGSGLVWRGRSGVGASSQRQLGDCLALSNVVAAIVVSTAAAADTAPVATTTAAFFSWLVSCCASVRPTSCTCSA